MVATYKNNMISPLLYPNIVFQVSKHYNNAYVLVETNDIGEQIANILQHDLEYENVLTTVNNGRSGQIISPGFGQAATRLGVRTTKSVKRVGCMNLKTQVESDKLIINDERILYELFRFVNIGESYEAEEGHDDLVMCCVLFAWAMGQSMFTGMKVTELIGQRIEPTLSLMFVTLVFAIVVAVPAGVLAAWKVGTWIDRFIMALCVLGFSVPVFVVGYLLSYFFAANVSDDLRL